MYALFAIPAAAFLVILVISLSEIVDFRVANTPEPVPECQS